jgi:hypothetical protein
MNLVQTLKKTEYDDINHFMQNNIVWVKPSIKEFDSAKDFIQGAGSIDGVNKEVGTPTDSAFADSIVSPS